MEPFVCAIYPCHGYKYSNTVKKSAVGSFVVNMSTECVEISVVKDKYSAEKLYDCVHYVISNIVN